MVVASLHRNDNGEQLYSMYLQVCCRVCPEVDLAIWCGDNPSDDATNDQ